MSFVPMSFAPFHQQTENGRLFDAVWLTEMVGPETIGIDTARFVTVR